MQMRFLPTSLRITLILLFISHILEYVTQTIKQNKKCLLW